MTNCTWNATNCNNYYRDAANLWLMFFMYNLPLIILGVLTICANGMILIVYIRTRLLKTATNFFLVAIALSDFLAGLIGIPTYIACNATYGYVTHLCESHATIFVFTSLCTISFIAVITADRYIAILYSLRYNVLMTKQRAKIIILVAMVTALILSVLPYFWVRSGKLHNPTADQRRADIIYTICILIPIVAAFPLMVYAYFRIFLEIRRQHKLTQEHERLRGDESSTTEREIRTVCVFAVMMIAYVFCWTPLAVIRVNLFISKSFGVLSPIPRYILQSLPFVTSFINPCCYGLGKKDFRHALSQSCKCGRVSSNQRRHDPTKITVC
ncbi:adenosine receptor A2b [Exaiptasia diaphana]|uniref:G-protein coupled receptors family 1 profile domain-containing protein n=1 Tax=Exaiptasia diaphana TaxID=2652724 RepID=A0A913YL25_EXADI|nr:adenosine receptor A2b [Exaiptasia diaphana]XP_028515722.1 adenosine receptor A2b [Exaiptasia diaphana]XP_028515723.1 adenosine receptor A2b [Exaiptasia diaphana]XP_028515724.1 adenosine receptor A2b [Exaiptasia diaphana]XP_028515725.1 adenosine receptor A2b [Exaiptasia diaphana]XP_028515726.1 adenosine receptor A2b [Exaiptasia diaphana]XP_028515727.1 adenosine receptor A2b [Exaiptasia diaphana]XP_028515728.1 adenosine receptor A2b [Exaiptasia diaphana]XP_028515729.1 adenosine receptor A